MNPLVTSQLTGLYEQATLQVKEPKPPKGWKKFTVMYREAMIIVSMDQPAAAVSVPVCPRCDSPRFYMDGFGLIWLKDQGLSADDMVCACTICGTRIWGLRPKPRQVCYFKAEGKFRRHPEDVMGPGEGDPYVEPDVIADEGLASVSNQAVSTEEVKRISCQVPVLVKKEKRHAGKRKARAV